MAPGRRLVDAHPSRSQLDWSDDDDDDDDTDDGGADAARERREAEEELQVARR